MESFKDLSMAQRTCSNDTTYRFVDKHPNFRWRQLSAKYCTTLSNIAYMSAIMTIIELYAHLTLELDPGPRRHSRR